MGEGDPGGVRARLARGCTPGRRRAPPNSRIGAKTGSQARNCGAPGRPGRRRRRGRGAPRGLETEAMRSRGGLAAGRPVIDAVGSEEARDATGAARTGKRALRPRKASARDRGGALGGGSRRQIARRARKASAATDRARAGPRRCARRRLARRRSRGERGASAAIDAGVSGSRSRWSRRTEDACRSRDDATSRARAAIARACSRARACGRARSRPHERAQQIAQRRWMQRAPRSG